MEIVLFWIGLSVAIGMWASSWGRSGLGWCFAAFLLSPLLAAIILAVSGRRTGVVEAKQLASGEARKCPFCAELVRREAVVCRYCNRDLPVQAAT